MVAVWLRVYLVYLEGLVAFALGAHDEQLGLHLLFALCLILGAEHGDAFRFGFSVEGRLGRRQVYHTTSRCRHTRLGSDSGSGGGAFASFTRALRLVGVSLVVAAVAVVIVILLLLLLFLGRYGTWGSIDRGLEGRDKQRDRFLCLYLYLCL
jgi:hypothetical protein